MDWKTLMATFGLTFVAELGDKTQLATMMMAAQSKSFTAVFLGSALALMASSLIGAAAGNFLGDVIPVAYLRLVAGGAFVLMGLLLLFGRL